MIGVGMRIEKPTDGTPWKFIVDGSSDTTLPDEAKPIVGYPYGNLWTFGIGFSGADVTIYNPRAKRFGDNPGGATQNYTCADATITLANGTSQRIVWEWNETSGLSIAASAQVNDPIDTPPTYRGTVCICDCVNGIACLSSTHKGASDQLGHLLILPLFSVPTT
jgi:hypothetical protein